MKKTLSFVIPLYNEEVRIARTFRALESGVDFDGVIVEKIIFVDDGSTDKTSSMIKKWIKTRWNTKKTKTPCELISYRVNRGKGYAVRQGLLRSKSDYTLFFDADISTPLTELRKLVPFMKNGTPVIIGTRKNGHSTVVKHQPLLRELLGKGFTLMSQIILDTWVTDFTCGFKAFSYEAKEYICQNAKVERWSYDAEMLFLAKKADFPIQEVPVIWSNDEGTKVNLFVDIPKTLIDLIIIRISSIRIEPISMRRIMSAFDMNQ